jgi:hypothetical protein
MSKQKTQKFLETAEPLEIIRCWRTAQGSQANEQFINLFHYRSPFERNYQLFRGPGNRINQPFLAIYHWLRFWIGERRWNHQTNQIAKTALAWRTHYRIGDPPVWKG